MESERPRSEQPFHEIELIAFIQDLLGRLDFYPADVDEKLGRRVHADLLTRRGDTFYVVEVKKDAPLTERRIGEVAEQLRRTAHEVYTRLGGRTTVQTVLATPGVLSQKAQYALEQESIELWDGYWLAERARQVGFESAAMKFIAPDVLYSLRANLSVDKPNYHYFSQKLKEIAPGKTTWVQYQKLCTDILGYLFCPPLETPLPESPNATGVNRRDAVLPNYADEGIWKFFREAYRADLVVVDAKNYSGLISKAPVLQISNYLTHHGVGLFALIMCRKGADQSANFTLREQWILYNKMIVVLDDEDLLQMLTTKSSGDDPALVVRQKIEDFRTGI